MIAMFKTDLIGIRAMVPQVLFVLVLLAVVCLGTGGDSAVLVFAPMVCVMLPFSFMTNLFATDELNGWQAFRLALPLSRGQVIGGRALTGVVTAVSMFVLVVALAAAWYALGPGDAEMLQPFALVAAAGCALALVTTGILMPFVARFGFTKAVRLVPMGVVLVVVLAFLVVSRVPDIPVLGVAAEWLSGLNASADALADGSVWTAVACAAAIVGVAAVVYGLLCLLAARLYRAREF